MSIKKVMFTGLAVVLLLSLVLAACAAPAPAPSPSPTPPPAPAAKVSALQKIIEAAKKEGAVVLNSGSPYKPDQLAQGIKDRFGVDVKVSIVPGSYAETMATTAMEVKGGIPNTFDVSQQAYNNAMEVGIPTGSIASDIDWPALVAECKDIDPGMYAPKPLNWMSPWGYIRTIQYDTKKTSPDQLPHSYKELTDPKYKGTFGFGYSSAAIAEIGYVYKWSDEQTLQFTRDLMANKPGLGRANVMVDKLAIGEYKFLIGSSTDVNEYNKKGATFGWVPFKDFLHINEHLMLVTTNAPHKNAATLLVLFFCTPAGLKQTEAGGRYFGWGPNANKDCVEYQMVEQAKKDGVPIFIPVHDPKYIEWVLNREHHEKFVAQIDLLLQGASSGGGGGKSK